MSEARNHHYLPVFYQKCWAKDGQIHSFQRHENGKITHSKKYPTQVCYKPLLNYLHDLPEEERNYLENVFFRKIDDDAGKILNRLIDDTRDFDWNGTGREQWAVFAFSFGFRHPAAMETLSSALEEWSDEIPDLKESYYQKVSPEEMSFEQAMESVKGYSTDQLKRNVIKTQIRHRAIIPHLCQLEWHVFDVQDAEYNLLTSDNPLVTNLAPFNSGRTSFLMPLSPTKIFGMFSSREQLEKYARMKNADKVVRLNRSVVGQALNFVIGINDKQLEFVKRRFSSSSPLNYPAYLNKYREQYRRRRKTREY